ncbi:MAG: hypothetical protein ACLP1D_20095 [Xanthobacteraceae bacterium]
MAKAVRWRFDRHGLLIVMARLDRAIQYPGAAVKEPRGGGVLGRQVEPGDDG